VVRVITTVLCQFVDWRLMIVVIILSATRVIFLLSGFIQEDAFITFRSSFNLADHGIYSFNLDEHYPGATSILFGYLVALIRVAFRSHAIAAVGAINSTMSAVAALFFAQGLTCHDVSKGERDQLFWLWCAIGICPPFLLIAAGGMETALLVLAVAIVFRQLAAARFGFLFFFTILLLPLIRGDAVAFGLLFIGATATVQPKAATQATVALILGVAICLCANVFAGGSLIPVTAIAKAVAYHPSRHIHVIAQRIFIVLFGSYGFLEVQTKYLSTRVYAAVGITFVVLFLLEGRRALRTSVLLHGYIPRFRSSLDAARLALIGGAILVPIAYAYGGVLFPWYFWPASALAYVIALDLIADRGIIKLHHPILGLAAIFSALLLLFSLNLAVAISIGYQERTYRTGIGKYIAAMALPTDTLFLEPAGYIPFYAGIKTYDEIGLASPKIIPFRKLDPNNWWTDFLRFAHPTFVVQREDILLGYTWSGGRLSADDMKWFSENYVVVKRFKYSDALQGAPPYIQSLIKLGTISDYLLFKYKFASEFE
jgi:hypothetical protein